MDVDKAVGYMTKQIEELEKSTWTFEHVVRPRYEADVAILRGLKESCFKLKTLQDRVEAGEEVSQQELYDAVPKEFR